MHRFTLRFAPDLEHRYREQRLSNDLKLLRIIATLAFGLSLLIFLLSWVAVGAGVIPSANRWLHFGVVVALGLGSVSTFRPQSYRSMDRRNELLLGVIAILLFYFERNVTEAGYVPVLCIYFFTQIAIFAQPFVYIVRARAIILTTILFSLGAWLAQRYAGKDATYLYIPILSGGPLTLFSAYTYERIQRLAFLAEAEIVRQRARVETLLHSIMPPAVAHRLGDGVNPNEAIVESYAAATVLFADIVGFTSLSASMPPERLVTLLNSLFSRFDAAAVQCGVEKIKTIGDAYMAVAGVPTAAGDHAHRMADFAFELREAVRKFSAINQVALNVRIGMHCGPVVAGVIGTTRFHYDLWGETVKVASQLESHGIKGEIQISDAMRRALGPNYHFEGRGLVELKDSASRLFILRRPLTRDDGVEGVEGGTAAANGTPQLPEAAHQGAQPGPTIAKAPIHPLTLRFAPGEESQYRDHRFAGDMKVYRTILLLSLATLVAVAMVSFVAIGRDYLGSAINWSHIGLITGVGVAALSAFYADQSFRAADLRCEGASLVISFVYGALAAFSPSFSYAGAIAGYFVILSGFYALPMIFAIRARTMIVFTIAFLAGLWISPGAQVEFASMINLFIASATGLYLFVAHSSERTQRSTYLAINETTRQRARANTLLRNIVPPKIADRLRDREDLQDAIVQRFETATVLFADLSGFTQLARTMAAEDLVAMLNALCSQIDLAALRHGVEKIKTIGYTYMAVAGVPDPTVDHVQRMADFALEVRELVHDFSAKKGIRLRAKIGMHCGPVVAGVIGTTRFHYDLWGETVNTASRLESHGVENAIQISAAVRQALGDRYEYSDRGMIPLKGMQPTQLHILTGSRSTSIAAA